MAWVSVALVPVLVGSNRKDLTLSAGTHWKCVCRGVCYGNSVAAASRELAALFEGGKSSLTPGLIIGATTG